MKMLNGFLKWRRFAVLAAAGILASVILACGGEATPQPAVDYGLIRSIIQDTVQRAVPPAPVPVSSLEIKKMVESAVAAQAASGVSSEEVTAIVSKTVTDAISQLPAPLTPEEVGQIVAAVLPGTPGLTAAQVQDIVNKAVERRALANRDDIGTMPTRLLGAPPDFDFSMYQRDDFWVSTLGGGVDLKLTDVLKAKIPLVVNFTAANSPSWTEVPGLQKVYNQMKGQFLLLLVDVGDAVGLGTHPEKGGLSALLEQNKVTAPGAKPKGDAVVVARYGLDSIPATLFITADGKLLRRIVRPLTAEEFKTRVDELMKISYPETATGG